MVLGWKSYHHHLTDKYTEVWWGWRIGEKLHKQVNDGRSRSGEESVSGVVWFAALYHLPLFLREYLSFYFSMTFFLYCGKIHITQSSLAWALFHDIKYVHTVVKPSPSSSPGDSHPANSDPLHPLNTNSSFPFPKPLVTTSLLSVSVYSLLSGPHTGGLTVFVLLGSHMSPDFAYLVICQWTLGLLPL